MKVKLKQDLFYSKLDNLVCMNKGDADEHDHEFLFDVINTFMTYGQIVHEGDILYLYMKKGDIIDLKEPTYSGPDYICNYHGLMLDFSTEGELEVII